MIALLLTLSLAGAPPSSLERSRAALAEADFEGALTLAEAAEGEAQDARALAEVYRQQGLVREVLGRADHALVAFARAIRCDPSIELDKTRAKRSTVELFSLARAMYESGADIGKIRQHLDARVGRDEQSCGSRAAPEPVVARGPGPAGPTWPVWTLGGLSLASGVAGAILGSLALGKNNDCNNQISHETYAECDAAATRLETGANIAWSSAGVAAAGAILIWFVSE